MLPHLPAHTSCITCLVLRSCSLFCQRTISPHSAPELVVTTVVSLPMTTSSNTRCLNLSLAMVTSSNTSRLHLSLAMTTSSNTSCLHLSQARAPYEFFGVWKPPFFGQSCQRKSVPTLVLDWLSCILVDRRAVYSTVTMSLFQSERESCFACSSKYNILSFFSGE